MRTSLTSRLLRTTAVAALAAGAVAGLAPQPAAAASSSSATAQPLLSRSIAARIVGGAPAGDAAWPWMTYIEAGDYMCGGSVIAPAVVLTAAHCLFDKHGVRIPDSKITVTVGQRNLRGTGGRKITVRKGVPHPAFKNVVGGDDIAILHLTAATGVPSAQLAQPGSALRAGDKAAIMGWGVTSEDGDSSAELLSAIVPLVAFEDCRKAYAAIRTTLNPRTNICAGYPQGGIDSCQGDSGGPMMVSDAAGAWKQIGIVSHGEGCARPGLAGVYTNVAADSMAAFIREGLAEAAGQPVPAAAPTQPTATTADSRPDATDLSLSRRTVRSGGRTYLTFAVPADAHITIAVLRKTRHGLVRLPCLASGHAAKGFNRVTIRTTRMRPGRYLIALQADDSAGHRSAIKLTPLRVRR